MSLLNLTRRFNGDLFPRVSLMSDFFDADRFFDSSIPSTLAATLPAVNIRENGNEFSLEVAAPGLKKDDFKINVENGTLTISAEKEEKKEEKDEKFTRREYSFNSFTRSFTLPQTVKSDDIKARYEDGVLKLSVPKKEEVKKIAAKEIRVS
jgi:HSP20 family protein